ncbi:MAG: methyltransferase domain-containing protein [Betaproteobacteria bacterium]|nr:methyltransferase domain-containing protein [Betaproteobacteria bacterium]
MSNNYDRIARFYDVDMARNMPFDDVGFYADLCHRHGGTALELGCGNGRILLELVARGIDAIGVDASAGMLRELKRKAAQRGLPARIARMDVTRPALTGGFGVILCPYSLVTYVTGDGAVARLCGRMRELLRPGGWLVVDAFVPRPVAAQDDFTLDYRRPFGEHTLARWKRLRPVDAATNRIERRYRLCGADGTVVEQVDVAETIRPYAPTALREAVAAPGLTPVGEWWDYGQAAGPASAQFFTLVARAP